jgi:hypothetical protein
MRQNDAPPSTLSLRGRRASGRASTRTDTLSATAAGWIKRAISVSFLMLATILGVQLGMTGPAVSPVSPAAISAVQPVASAAVAPTTPRVESRQPPASHDQPHV